MTKFNPYLNFAGNTEEAFVFYRSVFGGEFVSFTRFKDMPIEGFDLPEEAAEKIMHVGLPIGAGQMLMGTDALESMGQTLVVGNNVSISIHPDSRQEADRFSPPCRRAERSRCRWPTSRGETITATVRTDLASTG